METLYIILLIIIMIIVMVHGSVLRGFAEAKIQLTGKELILHGLAISAYIASVLFLINQLNP